MKELARSLVSLMPQLTAQRSAKVALENARLNLPYLQRTIRDLQVDHERRSGSALVIAAGPSLHRRKPEVAIQQRGYERTIIAADGALGYCLRNGIVPDYVVALDPHPTRVARWFGDPELEFRPDDDYFRRQDLDPYLGVNEYVRNRELIELVNRHGPQINLVASTSVSPAVTTRCLDAGMKIYWWNPMLDDAAGPGSLTREVYRLNKAPCMVCGGNVGSAAWIFAHQILKKKEIALVGMDLSYAPGTPLEQTQYYKEIKEIFGDDAHDVYITVYNPYLRESWYTDPAYFWYRQMFLQMARRADCVTFNCTEGGILFGKGVRFVSLLDFLTSLVPKQ